MAHPMLVDEWMNLLRMLGDSFIRSQIILSLFREEYPWIHDAGSEVLRVMKAKKSGAEKKRALGEFAELVEFSISHPVMKEFYGRYDDRELSPASKALPRLFFHILGDPE